jgi:predicted nucleic acid-binding protein
MKRQRVQERPTRYDAGQPVLFDTNVVVAGLVERHPHHDRAVVWFKRALVGEVRIVLAHHGLAECFAVLTVLPLKPAITPDLAYRLLNEGVIGTCKASVIALTPVEYLSVLARCAQRGMTGGVIHDAVLARCAQKAAAKVLTFNHKHFKHLCLHGADDVIVP